MCIAEYVWGAIEFDFVGFLKLSFVKCAEVSL